MSSSAWLYASRTAFEPSVRRLERGALERLGQRLSPTVSSARYSPAHAARAVARCSRGLRARDPGAAISGEITRRAPQGTRGSRERNSVGSG